MNNKFIKRIKFTLTGGKAKPIPPVSKLNDYNINAVAFCKQYNDLTKEFLGDLIPVEIFIFEDKTYKLNLKTPLTSSLILKELKLQKGSSRSKIDKIGDITKTQIEFIAKLKMKDFNTNNLQKAIKIVEGSAKSLGLNLI